MPTVIDELVTILGLDMKAGVGATVSKFNSLLDGVTRYASFAGAALVATASSVGYFVERTNRAASELEKFHQITGISTNRLQGMQYAIEKIGGSADSLQSDLMSLTKNMSSPIPGEYNQALFMLGVNLRKSNGEMKSADEVLLSISDKFQGMSQLHQVQWASRIGISDDTLLLLQMGREEIGRLQEEAKSIPTIVSEKQLKMAREFTIQMTLMRRMVTYVSQSLASSAGPALKEIVKDFAEFLRVNQSVIQSGLQAFVDGVVGGFRRFWGVVKAVKAALYEFAPSIKVVVDFFSEAEVISQLVYTTLLSLVVVLVILSAKFLLIAAGIVAAVAVMDDLITYFRGGESSIGALIEKIKELYQQFKENFPNITKFVEQVWDILVKIGKWTGAELVKVFKDLWTIVKLIADGLESVFGFMLKIVDKAMGFTLGDFLRGDWLSNEWGSGRAPAGPVAQPGSSTNTVTINQNISGANAPAIADETARETQQTLLNMFPGGLAPFVQ